MGRTKGTEKTGGRKKGTPNKVCTSLKDWIRELITNNKAQFEEDIANVNPEYRLKILERLISYVVPRRTDINVNEVMQSEYKHLEELLLNAPEEAIQAIAEKVIELQNINLGNE